MYCRKQFALLGVALMSAPGMNDDIATVTNADILIKILNVPLLSRLGENLKELPIDWRRMVDSTRGTLAFSVDTGL